MKPLIEWQRSIETFGVLSRSLVASRVLCFVSALALMIAGCTAKGFRDVAYPGLLGETIMRPSRPLAQRVHWVWCERPITKILCQHSNGFPRQVGSRTALAIPKETTSTADLFSQRAAYHRTASERSTDPGRRAHHRSLAVQNLQAAQLTMRSQQQFQRATTAVQLIGTSVSVAITILKAINDALGLRMVNEAIRWALVDTGFVGPGAPDGSILYVFLFSESGRGQGFSGYQYRFAASLQLKAGQEVIQASDRQTRMRIYTGSGIPDRAPEGFVEAQAAHKATGVELGDLALLMRSAANELSQAMARAREVSTD